MVEMVQFGRAVEDCAEECDLRVKACQCSQSPVDWCSHPLAQGARCGFRDGHRSAEQARVAVARRH